MKNKIKIFLLKIIYNFFKIFKVSNNKIVISNYYGLSGFSCNVKYIAEELLKSQKDFKIIWLLKNMDMTFPSKIKKVPYESLSAMYHLATAKVWIDSQRKRLWLSKKKNQLYIQTWHGCLAMKKIEMDALSSYGAAEVYKKERIHDTALIDIFLSGEKWFNEVIRRAFLYNGFILYNGAPRNDILVNNNSVNTDEIYKKIGVEKGKLIILYAPTFRKDEQDLSVYDLDYEKVIQEMSAFYNKDIVILTRLHPRMRELSASMNFNQHLIDVTKYDDIQELYLISDILITDYSSTIFDFSLQGKAGFIYASDIEEYKNDRNFYFDLFSLPYTVSTKTDELISNMKNFDEIEYRKKLDEFFEKVGKKESGNSAATVVKLIEDFSNGISKEKLFEKY